MILLVGLVAAIFGTWLGLTIAFQFMPPSPRWLRHINLLPRHVIPKWTFFAPIPGGVDYRVVFQDFRAVDDPVGNVREIPLHVGRSTIHAIWNPTKRARKAVSDVAQVIQSDPLRTAGPHVQTATPYLAILNVVMEPEATSVEARYRRFMIVATTGFNGEAAPVPTFVSYLHPFYPNGATND
jgi:hypothetical protein